MLLLTISLAWADAIVMSEVVCPPGSAAQFNHAGHWCAPVSCESECSSNDCIADVGLCIKVTTEPCLRRSKTGDDCSWEKTEVLGLCATDADCSTGSCVHESRCVTDSDQKLLSSKNAAPADAPPVADRPTRCSAVGLTSTALGLALILAAVARRRR